MQSASPILDPTPYRPSFWTQPSFDRNSISDSSLQEDYQHMTTAMDTRLLHPKMEGAFFPTLAAKAAPEIGIDHDSEYYSSRPSPPWQSSDNMSDSCSGTWSSPAASVTYSPSPRPKRFLPSYASWPHEHASHTFQPYTSLNEVQYLPDATPEYPSQGGTYHQPYYCTQWQYASHTEPQIFGTFGVGDWAAVYSRASPEADNEPSPAPSSTSDRSNETRQEGQEPAALAEIKQETADSTLPTVSENFHECAEPLLYAHTHSAVKQHNCTASAFPCPLAVYGCNSSFASKNEWKRHVNTQHLYLETWRCDLCIPKRGGSNQQPNDFNRKDLFVQHLRRMHCVADDKICAAATKATKNSKPSLQHQHRKMADSDAAIHAAERRCHISLRAPPPQSVCLFCDQGFRDRESWAARTEHVAKHLEKFRRDGELVPEMEAWNRDLELERWLVAQGVLGVCGRGDHKRLRLCSPRTK